MADCKKKTKTSIKQVFCRAAKAGGEPAYEAYKTAHNTFIGTLSGVANATVAVIEPILTIDTFVINTFVKPPLDATVKLLETSVKTVKVPLRIIGSLDSTGECARFHTGLRKGTDAVAKFITRDYNKLRNVADELDEWLGDRTALIEDLKALADTVNDLAVEETYQEFITSGFCS